MFDNARQWGCTPLIPALGRQRQMDLCEFEAPALQSEFQDRLQSYRVIQSNPVSKNKNKTTTRRKTFDNGSAPGAGSTLLVLPGRQGEMRGFWNLPIRN